MQARICSTIDIFKEDNKALGCPLPFSDDTSILSTPVLLGNKTAPNRLVCQAMEGCDGTPDGAPDELTVRRYHRLAEGGAGIIWFEATACLPEARANPRQLYLTEENLDAFSRLLDDIRERAVKANGYAPLLFMQDTHSGRYSKPRGAAEPIIAENNAYLEGASPVDPSRIITDEELDRVGEHLVKSARLAEQAGFDGVDIKCCHRYLNSELLSAYHRPGRYGGSLENRTRLLRESIAHARAVCANDFLVSTRLNVYDGYPYPYGFGVAPDTGTDFDPTEPIWLLGKLADLGVKVVNISMGNPYFNPHVNRPFVKGPYDPPEHPLTGVTRMLSGIATLAHAEPRLKYISSGVTYLGVAAPHVTAAYIAQGGFDFAGFGRTVFAYPDFARDILLTGEMKKEKICLCCSKCTDLMRAGSTPGCVVRDKMYTELYRTVIKGGDK